MGQRKTIDSNVTGLRYAEEICLKQLPVLATDGFDPTWQPLEPNSYADFGGQISTVARDPINPSRQRKKGVVTDLDAAGGFNTDLTQVNLQDILQGFFFADLRRKGEQNPTAVVATTNDYTVASETNFRVGDLIFASGFGDAANNGVKNVDAVSANTVSVSETLVADGAPATGSKIVVVGHAFATGDLEVDASGGFPKLTTTVKDLTQLGVIPGEWIFIGGDLAANRFTNATNNGFARVRSVSTNEIVLDKTDGAMVTETAAAQDVQLFLGRVLKNETGSLIKRRSYNLERTLGTPDDTEPTEVQAEYIIGAVPNELTLNIGTADKVNVDLSFVGMDSETIDGPTALKTGARPVLEEADAFNTSSDFSRIKLCEVSETNSAPSPLFAFATELTLTVNNNVSPNKAIGTLGAFEATSGTFEVGGSMEVYFADVASIAAVRNNSDITLDAHIVKSNAGVTFDVPLLTLGDGRPNVEKDQPIKLPLTKEAATAAKIDSALDYTLLMQFWDYLPNLADS